MKIRYYLRGLGLGILVTAIFFMVSGKNSQTMSDEMIKARAKELGMTESGVLSDLAVADEETVYESVPEETEEVNSTEGISEENESQDVTDVEEPVVESVEETAEPEISVVEESVEEETSVEESEEETVVETASQSSDKTQETEANSESTENAASNIEPVSVTVNRGEGSDTVSRRLQELGLVADAYEYDRYLMANGYDKRIGAGEHVIPAGATWEDIAKILCNMK